MMKSFVAGLLAICLAACSSAPLKKDEIHGSFHQNLEKLYTHNSFGFTHGQDQYYFSNLILQEGEHRCYYFVGFKNDQYRYSFRMDRLAELSKIYYDKLTLDQKRDLALKKIESFEIDQRGCTKEIAIQEMSTSKKVESAITFVFFAPLIPIGMIFGADLMINDIKQSRFAKKLDQIRLGMGKEEIEYLIGETIIKRKVSQYEYYTTENGHRRMAMAFEDDRLIGFVRGDREGGKHAK